MAKGQLWTPGDEPVEEQVQEESGYPVGYRAWTLRFKNKEPRLGALTREDYWEPEVEIGKDPITGENIPVKIVKSDWPGEEQAPWDRTPYGLYMLKSLKDVKSQFPGRDIYGSIIPYGKIREGSIGYRAHKAKVSTLFRNVVNCYICKKAAKFFVHNNERFPLCEKCTKRMEKLIQSKGYTQEEVEEVLQRLAEIYEADVQNLP